MYSKIKNNSLQKACVIIYALVGIILLVPDKSVRAQKRETVIKQKRPEVTHGPYITGPTETSVTITWKTGMPAHSRIKYGTDGRLNQVTEPVLDGFIPVDTLHSINLTNLQPGQSYNYKIISTGVKKLKPYWPVKTLSYKSPVYSFSTLDSEDSTVYFSFITDSQYENVDRLNANLDLVNWQKIDFLVYGGDALSWVKGPKQIFSKFLDPITARLDHQKPLVYVRGNHEMRGPYARSFKKYVSNSSEKFYYAFDAGPVHFIVLDTGEDKADSVDVYGGLNNLKAYRNKELQWFKNHVETSKELARAPFRVILMHQPRWGWVNGNKDEWREVANKADIDLVIAGHWHKYARVPEGKYDNNYPILVIGQDQAANVRATKDGLNIVVKGKNNTIIDSFTIR